MKMRDPILKTLKNPWIIFSLGLGLLSYLFAAIFFPIISDEFHEAVEVYSLFKKVPYRDYFYYKNVLGYYLKYPFLFLFNDWFNSILFSRVALGITWVLSLFYFLKRAARPTSEVSFFVTFLMGLFLTNNLLHGASYRVDMLTAVAGLFSFLFLKDKKYFWAGILASLSFFISQKGIWFCVSGFVALALYPETRKELLPYLRGGLTVGVLYVGVFGLLSSPSDVLYGIFLKDTNMATSAGYQIRHYWSQSFFENWPFWLTSGAGASLLILGGASNGREYKRDGQTLSYFLTFIFLFSLNPQSWPYNFVFITPFLCYFAVIAWEAIREKIASERIFAIVTLMALVVPLFNLVTNHKVTNTHQRALISTLEDVLKEDDTYIAGFNLLPRHKQVHPFFKWLSAIERNKAFNLNPEEIEKLIEEWEKQPAKALVVNYRTRELPLTIQHYLKRNYHPFWGNLYLRAINIFPNQKTYKVPFGGSYILFPKSSGETAGLIWNGETLGNGKTLPLSKGQVKLEVKSPGILMFFPGKLNLSVKHKREMNLNFSYD